MRIYADFREAHSEIKRDLAEMGIRVHPHSYQDKIIKDDPDFETLEIQNYMYTVTQPNLEDLNPTQPWASEDFKERVSGIPINPGEAWKLRSGVWNQFLEEDGRFAYTYAERLAHQWDLFIREAMNNPDSRQLFLGMWNPNVDPFKLGGVSRVPCTLGYMFQVRRGRLNLTYLMRSCDFITHFQNDVWIAHSIQRWLAEEIGRGVGNFTQWIASLHVFQKDVEGVF